jgi:hypothetical protein
LRWKGSEYQLRQLKPDLQRKSPSGGELCYTSFMGKWVHRLSKIDPIARTATCAHCGPVKLKPYYREGAIKGWRCRTAWRNQYRGSANLNDRTGGNRGYRLHKGSTCERCGFVAEHPRQLDVHHRDGNWRNNDLANLQTLCANCHRLTEMPGFF